MESKEFNQGCNLALLLSDKTVTIKVLCLIKIISRMAFTSHDFNIRFQDDLQVISDDAMTIKHFNPLPDNKF